MPVQITKVAEDVDEVSRVSEFGYAVKEISAAYLTLVQVYYAAKQDKDDLVVASTSVLISSMIARAQFELHPMYIVQRLPKKAIN